MCAGAITMQTSIFQTSYHMSFFTKDTTQLTTKQVYDRFTPPPLPTDASYSSSRYSPVCPPCCASHPSTGEK